MREIIANHSKKTNHKRSRKAFKAALPRLVVVLVLIFVMTTIFVANVEAIRIKVLNFMMDETEKYTSVDKRRVRCIRSESPGQSPDWEGQILSYLYTRRF